MLGRRSVTCFSFLLFLTGCASWVEAQPLCLEDCQKNRDTLVKSLQDCLSGADKNPDRAQALDEKKYCRKRFQLANCNNLKPCPKISPTPVADPGTVEAGIFKLQKFEILGKKKRFLPGQSVEISYELGVQKSVETIGAAGGRSGFSFNQEVVILEALADGSAGREVFHDTQILTQNFGLQRTFQFKSSFKLPADFPAGSYQLVLRLDERLTKWKGEEKAIFQVGR